MWLALVRCLCMLLLLGCLPAIAPCKLSLLLLGRWHTILLLLLGRCTILWAHTRRTKLLLGQGSTVLGCHTILLLGRGGPILPRARGRCTI